MAERQRLQVLVLNQISAKGLERLPAERYASARTWPRPTRCWCARPTCTRMDIPASVRAIGRAGAGTNNIPVEAMSARGVPVFNAPGANANAVKELVLAGMLMAARNLSGALRFVDDARRRRRPTWTRRSRTARSAFAGFELAGQTLGIVGLGKVGCLVADAAIKLGMNVLGYDPDITVDAAWSLPSQVKKAGSVAEVLRNAHFVTLHVPLVDATRHLVNADNIGLMRAGAVLLNFSREGVVERRGGAGGAGRRAPGRATCATFPSAALSRHERVICLPHLGASTREAEENCAVMVVDQLRDYLEHGNVANAVNFPQREHGARVGLPRGDRQRQRAQHARADLHRDGAAPASTSTTWSTSRAATWPTRWSTWTAR